MEPQHKLAAALWEQRCAFWRMVLGETRPNWKLLEDLHRSICAAEARYRQLQVDSRQAQLQDAWKYGLMATAPNWRSLERIAAELSSLERPPVTGDASNEP